MTEIRNRAEVRLIQALQRVVGLTRTTKFGLILLMDGILCVFAVWIAFMLRLGEWHLWTPAVIVTIAISLILWLPLFLIRGIYQSIVRFMGARTIANIATSCMIMAVALSLIFTFNPIQGIPRTIGVIHALIFATLLVLSRVVAGYALFDLLNRRRFEGQLSRVLIYGAGSAGRQLALSLRHEPGMALQGYIDDDPRLSGQRLDGVAIHASDEVGSLIARLEVDTVLLAIPRLSRQHRKAIVSKLENANVHVLTLPAMSDMIDGTVSVADLREIEIDDLLGRDAVPPNDLLLHRTITGRIVMVTGAGGSIGSELCRQIGTLNPTTIILVEMTEHALYSIEGELREAQRTGRIDSQIVVHAELGNVADAGTVRRMFDRWKPDTVFHAAAYKHVPLVEENVIAGMRNAPSSDSGALSKASSRDRPGRGSSARVSLTMGMA